MFYSGFFCSVALFCHKIKKKYVMEKDLSKNRALKESNLFEENREISHRKILSSVSHDLKTPLSGVIGSLETYQRTKSKLTEDKKDILINTALQESYRLDSFINNILDMARLEAKIVSIKKEKYRIDLLLEDCLIDMGNRLKDCKIEIKAHATNFFVNMDHLLLMRAICIILDNAAKYCSITTVIKIDYEKSAEFVIIRIQDSGPGIPESQKEEIFCKYARIAKQDYKQGGTGLGLPICRAIMNLLGGSVTTSNVGNEMGRGAIFALIFLA